MIVGFGFVGATESGLQARPLFFNDLQAVLVRFVP
jgi:hypothetical protein